MRDREAEKSELDKIRQEILAEGDPKKTRNIDSEAKRRMEKIEIKKMENMSIGRSPTFTPITPAKEVDLKAVGFKMENNQNSGWEAVTSPSTSTKLSIGTKINMTKMEMKMNGVFEDDNEEEPPPKKKMKPFQISSEERIATLTPEERKRMIRELIDTIPKTKDAIFSFPIHWDLLDSNLIETRIKPWVAKKVIHYIGEEEPALVTFICDCIKNKTDPKKLILDLSMVVDEEADSFVTKMWRLIIYETEAKRTGLTKDVNSTTQDQTAS